MKVKKDMISCDDCGHEMDSFHGMRQCLACWNNLFMCLNGVHWTPKGCLDVWEEEPA